MNAILLSIALAVLLGGMFTVASTAIGIECYNNKDNASFKEIRQSNYGFMVFNLVSAILLILCGIFGIYAGARAQSQ